MTQYILKSVFILFPLYCTVYGQHGGCKITLPSDIPKNEPVYLVNKGKLMQLYKPTQAENNFPINKKIEVFCPGKNNKLKLGTQLKTNVTELSCRDSGMFNFNSINYKINAINCTKSVSADINTTHKKCAKTNGKIYEIGFRINSKIFLALYEVCFDDLTVSTFWSKHTINGKAIRFSVKENERKEFKTNGIPSTVQPASSYKKLTQIEHFKVILGSYQQYFDSSSYLARGHLTPDADFIFTSAQFATYFYINVCPQFQSVNSGNWLRVESLARHLAQHYNTDLRIYTGVYDQLNLTDYKGDETELFLTNNNKIIVPKWLWKVIKNEETNSAIVMITLNNPFADKSEINTFCTNVCDKANLSSTHFLTMRKGYTFCCELNEFKATVKTLPADLNAATLLSCGNLRLP